MLRHNQPLGAGGFVVKEHWFSFEHIAAIFEAGDLGTPVSQLCRQHGVSEQGNPPA